MVIETRHLRLVALIRQEGTLTGAAERLHLTQPAASHALRELERRLGVELFTRGRSGMSPTLEGERLLATADRVLPELERAEEDLREFRSGARGVVRLTTECYTCYHWLPPVLASFQREFPRIDLRIVTAGTDRPIEALLAGEADLAIVHTRPEHREVLAHPLFTDEMVAVLPAAHPLATRQRLEAKDFADQHLIVHSEAEDSPLFSQVLIPAGVRPRRISELHLTEAVLESVRAGLGLTVMARWAVEEEVGQGGLAIVAITRSGLSRSWFAATLVREAERPPLAALVARLDRRTLAAPRSAARVAPKVGPEGGRRALSSDR